MRKKQFQPSTLFICVVQIKMKTFVLSNTMKRLIHIEGTITSYARQEKGVSGGKNFNHSNDKFQFNNSNLILITNPLSR